MKELKCPKCGTTIKVDEKDYNEIVKQVRDDEFKSAVQEREKYIKTEMKAAAEKEKVELENKKQAEIAKLNADIITLKGELKAKEVENNLAIKEAVFKKDSEISKLQDQLNYNMKDFELEKNKIKEDYESKLKEKDEQVAYYKDLKTKMSTKLVGETLEQHCQIEFNKQRIISYPNAYFEKDNDAKSGSKGDYIFREKIEGTDQELISIMFEMKNESDTTATKHKNEDFFKELDKDRREKGCEYAVLVSMLEADNEYYNSGIVDVSYRYPKMFVVRPQNFMAIIGLLKTAALNSVQYKKELSVVKNQNVDVSNFENELNAFKESFNVNYERATKNYNDLLGYIDATIDKLTKAKESLVKLDSNFGIANRKAQDITIKKLTKNSPSVLEAIVEARDNG